MDIIMICDAMFMVFIWINYRIIWSQIFCLDIYGPLPSSPQVNNQLDPFLDILDLNLNEVISLEAAAEVLFDKTGHQTYKIVDLFYLSGKYFLVD